MWLTPFKFNLWIIKKKLRFEVTLVQRANLSFIPLQKGNDGLPRGQFLATGKGESARVHQTHNKDSRIFATQIGLSEYGCGANATFFQFKEGPLGPSKR